MPRRPQGLRLNVRNVGRQNRYTQVARALGQGTAYAFRNRRAIISGTRTATQAARSILSRSTGYLRRKFTPGKSSQRSTLRDTDRINQDLGTGAELTKEHVTIGRAKKLKLKGYAGKLLKSSEQTQILRFSGINQFMNTTLTNAGNPKGSDTGLGGGFYRLYNWYDGSAFYYMPCHIFDVTSINNIITTGGVATYTQGAPGWELRFNGNATAPTDVSFTTLNNKLGDGTSGGGKWQAEDTAALASNAGSQPLRRTIQDWLQAKLLCYGSAKMVTEYVIEFIQLKEDWLHPDFVNVSDPTLSGEDYHAASMAFWQHYVKNFVAHPIATDSPLKRNMYRVLKTIRFTLQPRLSNETDANVGHCKQINIFNHMNRLCKYDWAETGLDSSIGNWSYYAVNQGQLQCYTHPKARIYMTVRALNPTGISNAATSTDYTPSYDLMLRKKYTTMQ